jgi:hypothetical protein
MKARWTVRLASPAGASAVRGLAFLAKPARHLDDLTHVTLELRVGNLIGDGYNTGWLHSFDLGSLPLHLGADDGTNQSNLLGRRVRSRNYLRCGYGIRNYLWDVSDRPRFLRICQELIWRAGYPASMTDDAAELDFREAPSLAARPSHHVPSQTRKRTRPSGGAVDHNSIESSWTLVRLGFWLSHHVAVPRHAG